jgi:hypothetical protein
VSVALGGDAPDHGVPGERADELRGGVERREVARNAVAVVDRDERRVQDVRLRVVAPLRPSGRVDVDSSPELVASGLSCRFT